MSICRSKEPASACAEEVYFAPISVCVFDAIWGREAILQSQVVSQTQKWAWVTVYLPPFAPDDERTHTSLRRSGVETDGRP